MKYALLYTAGYRGAINALCNPKQNGASRMLYKEIPLTRGFVTIVDEEDYETLARFKWNAARCGVSFYAARSVGGRKNKKISLMHRVIMDAPPKKQVDHINGNPLDNRRSNLRICTQVENSRNIHKKKINAASHYKGVCWDKNRNIWMAKICIKDGKTTNIGYFKTQEDAALAYNECAIKYFGEFAYLNVVP